MRKNILPAVLALIIAPLIGESYSHAQANIKTTLHNAASATGNGTPVNVQYYSTIGIQVTGAWTGTLTPKVSQDGVNLDTSTCANVATGAVVSAITGNGSYQCSVAGSVYFYLPLTWTSGTSVTVKSDATTAVYAASGGGGTAQGSATSGTAGNLSLCAVTSSTPTYTTAQNHPCSMNTSGETRVHIASSAVGSNSTDDDGTVPGGTANDSVVIDKEYRWDGSNWKRVGYDPCAGSKTFVAISQATGTQVITGTAAKRIFVCSIVVKESSSSTQTFSIVAGTGSVCATNTVAIFGATTAANGMDGGFAIGNGQGAVAKTTVDADNICILQSSTDRINGEMSYVTADNY